MNYLPKSDNFPLEPRQQLHNDYLLQPLSTSQSVNFQRLFIKTTPFILEKKALAWEHNLTTWAVPKSWRDFPIHVYDFVAPGSAPFMFSFPDTGQEMKHFLSWFSTVPAPPQPLQPETHWFQSSIRSPNLECLTYFIGRIIRGEEGSISCLKFTSCQEDPCFSA